MKEKDLSCFCLVFTACSVFGRLFFCCPFLSVHPLLFLKAVDNVSGSADYRVHFAETFRSIFLEHFRVETKAFNNILIFDLQDSIDRLGVLRRNRLYKLLDRCFTATYQNVLRVFSHSQQNEA